MNKNANATTKAFITAILIIAVLMVLTYILTLIVPGGEYERIIDSDGNTLISPESNFSHVDGGIPLYKWILSPILLLSSNGSGTVIAIILFLLVIGGVFECLNTCGLIKYILDKIVFEYEKSKYALIAVISLFFMLLGSFIGSFEECVPFVPIIVALSVTLGWNPIVGLGMSLLAIGCGFAAGVCNPFTIGVAQKLCGLPAFSGIWLRLFSFIIIYLLLITFLISYAKRVEQSVNGNKSTIEFKEDILMNKGMILFISSLLLGLVLILSSAVIPSLQSYTMIIVACVFLFAGIPSALCCRMSLKKLIKCFISGVISVAPAIIMILMAGSIKYTLEEARVLDTILHFAVETAKGMPKAFIILFIYVIVLITNFFISSGSAKAVLLIPLIAPLAQMFGISPQLCVLAFAFGDGFSNVLYPTNPVLLISLGVANVSYIDWFKWSSKFQAVNFIITALILLFGLYIGY